MGTEVPVQAMTDGTETPAMPAESAPAAEPQTPETPTEPQAQAPEAPAPKKSLKQLLLEDPDYKREHDEEINRRVQKSLSKKEREWERARLAEAAEDPSKAIQYAQERKASLDTEAAADQGREAEEAGFHAALADAFEDGDWKAEYEGILRDQADDARKRWGESPKKFFDWADKQVNKRLFDADVARAVKAALPTVAQAEAEHRVAQALRNIPTPPMGPGGKAGGDDAFLAAYGRGENDDHERARKILDSL